MFLWSVCLLALLRKSTGCDVADVPDSVCPSLQSVQDQIVAIHNEFRRGVVPSASNMLRMSWSAAVAASAQKWVNACALKHGPSSSRMLGNYEMGENLFNGENVSMWKDVVSAWHNEVRDYRYPTGTINGKPTGHFTQVISYGSYQVGCGVAKCDDQYFFGCQYNHAGNFRGIPPYIEGESCSACPEACDNKLCTNPCTHVDTFANCPIMKRLGVCRTYLRSWCKAQCKCPTQIISF